MAECLGRFNEIDKSSHVKAGPFVSCNSETPGVTVTWQTWPDDERVFTTPEEQRIYDFFLGLEDDEPVETIFLEESELQATVPAGPVKPIETVKQSTMGQYISAIVSLWDLQVRQENSKEPHPRSKGVSELLDNMKKDTMIKRKESHQDRGLGTKQDVLTVSSGGRKPLKSVESRVLDDGRSFLGLAHRVWAKIKM